MVTFTNVADYGSFKQWAVVVFGVDRFVSVSANADVIPGQTVDTAGYITMWYSTTTWGWTSPTWSSDGSQISYVFDGSMPYSIPANSTAPGMIGSELFDIAPENFPYYPNFFAWAPPGPREDQLLYSAWARDEDGYLAEYIFVGTAGSTSPGDTLVQIGENVGHTTLGLAWLPDSSGFLYSKTEGWNEYANIFKYSFTSGTSTRLTDFTSGYPRRLSISPDGMQVVYEYQANGEWTDLYVDLDLWMMDSDGNGRTLFVQNARAPAWSPVAVPEPVVYDHYIFLPSVLKH
jgi:Tol biopolymer transport system component